MTLHDLERTILNEARILTKNPKLKQKEILEWSTGPIAPHAGERVLFLPTIGVHIALAEAPAIAPTAGK